MFDKEAEGLKLLSSTPFRIPKILKQGTFQKWSYLILEFINDKGSSYSDKKLGENLAKMHSITSNHFLVWNPTIILVQFPNKTA